MSIRHEDLLKVKKVSFLKKPRKFQYWLTEVLPREYFHPPEILEMCFKIEEGELIQGKAMKADRESSVILRRNNNEFRRKF